MAWLIRAAAPTDAPAIAAIWNPVILQTLVTFNATPRSAADIVLMIQQKTETDHAFLLAEAQGRVLGFASYGQFRSGSGYARTMENTIILAPEARGRGLGRALMAAIEEHAVRRGAHSMIAGVSAANPAGRAFHAALGYREVAMLPEVGFKAGRWLDLVLMQKLL